VAAATALSCSLLAQRTKGQKKKTKKNGFSEINKYKKIFRPSTT
jgi:hypothetical protein